MRATAHQLSTSYLKDSTNIFRQYKRLGDRAMAQCPDEALFVTLDEESNSIAIIVKHLAGNMRSRWRDFLTTDGEKPDRNRDTEFEAPPKTRAELTEMWEGGWKYLFEALEALTDTDMTKTVTIRSSPHSVMQAINRQVAHYAHHVGQIILFGEAFCDEGRKEMGNIERSARTVATVHGGSSGGEESGTVRQRKRI